MNRSRYWLHLAFWLSLFLTVALNLLNAETRGGITDGDGAERHLIAMGLLLLPMARVVYLRAWDAGSSWWVALLAVPASVSVPFAVLVLGLVPTPARRGESPAASAWWLAPMLFAGIGLGWFLSLILR